MSALISLSDIYAARERIAGVAVRTPLVRLEPERLRAAGIAMPPFEIYLKAESAQPIGSFKLRGAYNMAGAVAGRGLAAGTDYVLVRQPCAGRGLCGARAGDEGGNRDAGESAGGEDRGDAGARGGDRDGG